MTWINLVAEHQRATHIAPHEVHLWQCTTAISYAAMERIEALLTDSELARANRFSRPADRQRFVVSRGALRSILASHLDMEAPDVPLIISPRGRPILAEHVDGEVLNFSVSHAGEQVMLAFGLGIDVGVDVERSRSERPLREIAARVFGPNEQRHLAELDGQWHTWGFYRIWTLREAYLKAIGQGLSGWSGRDIALGAKGQLSPENPDRQWLAFEIDNGSLALSQAPERIRAWQI